MKALHSKLVRDLARTWAQALTIALVLACGVASYVTMRGTYTSIVRERDAYYADRRFADVFAHVERAPAHVQQRIQRIPGVARVYTRVVHAVLVPIEGAPEPAVGQVVSLPATGEAPLDAPRLRSGRLPERGRGSLFSIPSVISGSRSPAFRRPPSPAASPSSTQSGARRPFPTASMRATCSAS